MGWKLVAAVLQSRWSNLTHLQFRVLVFMANTALDQAQNGMPKGLYWAGHKAISLSVFGTDDPSKAQNETIRVALAGLVKAGAIERLEVATGHRRSRYLITVDKLGWPKPPPVAEQVDPTTDGGLTTPVDPISDGGYVAEVGPTSDGGLDPTSDGVYLSFSPNYKLEVAPTSDRAGGEKEERNKRKEIATGDIDGLSAQPSVGDELAHVRVMPKCSICGRTERRCRALADKHGGHTFTPRAKETA